MDVWVERHGRWRNTRAVCRAPISSFPMQLRGLLVLECPHALCAHPVCLRSRKAQRTGHGKVLEACYGCSTLRAEQALGKILISLSSTVLDRSMSFQRGYRNVAVLKKMTFPNDKVLTIELSEKQISGRTISMTIDYEDILSADAFDSSLLIED